MTVGARSVVISAIAVIAAGAIAIPPSLAPPTQAVQRVHLAAQTSLLPPPSTLFPTIFLPRQGALTQPIGAAPLVAPVTPTPTLQTGPILSGLGAGLSALYYSLLPWIDYAVNLAQYAVGFIPWVGLLAPQIGIIYYNFVRPVANSLVDNLSGFLQGNVGLVLGIGNILTVAGNSLIALGVAEVNWLLGFLPPLPPFPFAATAAPQQLTALAQPTQTLNPDVAVTKTSLKTAAQTDDLASPSSIPEPATAPETSIVQPKKVVPKPTDTPVEPPTSPTLGAGPKTTTLDKNTDGDNTDNTGKTGKPQGKIKNSDRPDHDGKGNSKTDGGKNPAKTR